MSLFPRHRVLTGTLLLVLLTCLAYFPALGGGFIWDDVLYVTKADLIKAPNGLYRFWFTSDPVDYYPVSNSSLWVEWRLWGMNPAGYHVTNLILHIASALLLWRILWTLSVAGGYLAALIFAVHPVEVEAVAWISQRKDVLATLFFLMSVLWYLRDEEARGTGENDINARKGTEKTRNRHVLGGWYWLSALAFVLAMLSKGSAAILPVVLLGFILWRRKARLGDLLRLAPFFLIAAALTVVNISTQHATVAYMRNAGFAERVAGAGTIVWFYLSKALLPIHLLFVYPQWHIQVDKLLWWLPLSTALITGGVLLWCGRTTKAFWSKRLLFAWSFFVVALVPVLGFTDVGFMQFSLVADHYQHIAIIGVAVILAVGCWAWHERSRGARRLAVSAGMTALIGLLTFLTLQQSRLYGGNTIALYEASLRGNPDCWVAHNNLGTLLDVLGRSGEAKQHFERALQLKPDSADAHFNLGLNLAKAGDSAGAIRQYQAALLIAPTYIKARDNLGIELCRAGRLDEAIECFKQSIRIEPRRPENYFNLGNALSLMDRPEDAAEQFRKAIKVKPDYAEAWANLAAAYGDLGRWDLALAAADDALKFARAQGLTEVTQAIEAWRNAHAAKLNQPSPINQNRP